MTTPDPTNKPAPMTPPIAIIVRCRCLRPFFSSTGGAPMSYSFERAGLGPDRAVQKTQPLDAGHREPPSAPPRPFPCRRTEKSTAAADSNGTPQTQCPFCTVIEITQACQERFQLEPNCSTKWNSSASPVAKPRGQREKPDVFPTLAVIMVAIWVSGPIWSLWASSPWETRCSSRRPPRRTGSPDFRFSVVAARPLRP